MPRGEPASKRKKRTSGTSRTTLNEKLSNDELLRQLKSLSDELSNAEQTSASKYDATAAFLATPFVLKHKDKGVRLHAACCLVDILRIYAPEAPFDKDQMWDVFSLTISQLRGLEHGTKGINYKKHFYVLESLALVRTFNICTDLDFQDLILQLFKLLFSVVNDNHPIKVLNFMVEVMSPVFEDGESISQELLDTVLVNIIEPQKSHNSAAYKVACNLIERTSSNIEPFIQMFFNSVLTLGKTSESDLADRVYDLILELNRISSPVLLAVLPQLEYKLKSTDVDERIAVTKLLAQMFSDPDSELASQNKPLWNSYLGRFLDINVDVRVECVKKAKYFLASHPGLAADVSDKLSSRSRDPDERVRQEMVTATCEAALENMKCISDKMFEEVCERMRDKKWHVRKEALMCLGKLYKNYTTGTSADPAAAKKLSWVPSKILKGYYQNTVEDRLCVERVLSGCLVPVSLPTEDRMKRLMSVYTKLDDIAVRALQTLLKCQGSVRADLTALIELADKEKTDDNEKMILSHIITLASKYGEWLREGCMLLFEALPEPFKAQESLKKLPDMLKEPKMKELLKTCVSPNAGCPAVFKAVSDVIIKLGIRNPILETMKALLNRAAPILVDATCVKNLLKIIKDVMEGLGEDEEDEFDNRDELVGSSPRGTKGLDLLVELSGVFPSHFQSSECYELLLVFLKHHDQGIVNQALHILSNIGEEMETCSKSIIPYYQPVLSKLAAKGTPQQCKYAFRSLAKIFNDPMNIFDRIFTNVVESLEYEHPLLLTHLTSLAEIAVLAPSLFETKQKFIIRDFVVKELLVKDRCTQEEADQEDDEEWCEDCDVTRETQAKIKAIKLMVRWLQGLQGNHKNSGVPVLRLLSTVLAHGGDLQHNSCVCPHDCSRLRLAASCGMLKIAQEIQYDEVIALEHYQQLALTIQDPCSQVREKFTKKLHKSLDSLKLPLEYLAIFALAATETDKDRRTQVRQMIARNVAIRKEYLKQHSAAQACSHSILPEYALPCVIHLLAHHPDFNPQNTDSLVQFKEYMWFFMEPIVANKTENSGLLKKIFENIKQTKDAQCPEDEEANAALYTLCDLAFGLIMNKATGLVGEEFPGNPILPKKMFVPRKMTTPNTKSYLPKGFIFFAGKKKAGPTEPGKASARLSTSGKGKRPVSAANKKTATKRQTKPVSKKTFKQMANDAENSSEDVSGYVTDDTPESGFTTPPTRQSPRKRGRPPASPEKLTSAAKKSKVEPVQPSSSRKKTVEMGSETEPSSQEDIPKKGAASRGRKKKADSPTKKEKPDTKAQTKQGGNRNKTSKDDTSAEVASPRRTSRRLGKTEEDSAPESPARRLGTIEEHTTPKSSARKKTSRDDTSAEVASPRRTSRRLGKTEEDSAPESPARRLGNREEDSTPESTARRLGKPEEDNTPESPARRSRTAAPSSSRGTTNKTVFKVQETKPNKVASSPTGQGSKSPRRGQTKLTIGAGSTTSRSPRKTAERQSPRKKVVGSLNKVARSPFRAQSPSKISKSPSRAGRAARKLQSELDSLPEDDTMESSTYSTNVVLSPRRLKQKANKVQLNGLSRSPKKRSALSKTESSKPSPSKKRKAESKPTKQASPSKKPKTENKTAASPSKKKADTPSTVLNVRRRNTRRSR